MTQAALFEAPARQAGHLAAEQCAAKAERTTTFSTYLAKLWVLEHLKRHGPTSGEELVDGMKTAGFIPHDDRAFGPVFQSLSREKHIQKYGYAERAKGHGTAGGVIWRIVR